jgi:hypothetical protein
MRAITVSALCAVVVIGVSAGCADDDLLDPLENRITCQDVCESYDDCIEVDYDVAGCRSRCQASAADDEAWQRRLDACDDCLDDRSCSEGDPVCAAECAGILP